MIFRLHRHPSSPRSTQGDLSLDGNPFTCYTLEPPTPIPAGTYEVALTVSERSTQGKLWSPRVDHVLPVLSDVPEHTGIRIHSGNGPQDTEDCILVGYGHGADEIISSHSALIALMAKIEGGQAAAERVFIEIIDA